MSIKPQYETYRYTSEICKVHGQTVVECRLPGSEINAVLAVNPTAVSSGAICQDGEVKLTGKLLLSIVYEDANKCVCRAERGAEFFVDADKKEITPACVAKPKFTVKNVTTRREGSGLYLCALIEYSVRVFGTLTAEYLTGGENVAVKKVKQTIVKEVCVSGETELEDEFDTEYFSDLLLHSERVQVIKAKPLGGEVEIAGELSLNLCALKGDGELCPYERLIPFNVSIPCDEHGARSAEADVFVTSANLTVTTDEEKGNSKIFAEFTLTADCTLYIEEEIECALDAFSPTNEMRVKRENRQGRYLSFEKRLSLPVSGGAAISPAAGNGYKLIAALLPKGEAVFRKRNGESEIEGIIETEAILKGEDGLHKVATVSMPFSLPAPKMDEEDVEIDLLCCGLAVRKRGSGEVDAEGTLKIVMKGYSSKVAEYIVQADEGEEYEVSESAFSVFVPSEGDGLWEVAKRLKRYPEEVEKDNPTLEFPVKRGARIVVYRQKE